MTRKEYRRAMWRVRILWRSVWFELEKKGCARRVRDMRNAAYWTGNWSLYAIAEIDYVRRFEWKY